MSLVVICVGPELSDNFFGNRISLRDEPLDGSGVVLAEIIQLRDSAMAAMTFGPGKKINANFDPSTRNIIRRRIRVRRRWKVPNWLLSVDVVFVGVQVAGRDSSTGTDGIFPPLDATATFAGRPEYSTSVANWWR